LAIVVILPNSRVYNVTMQLVSLNAITRNTIPIVFSAAMWSSRTNTAQRILCSNNVPQKGFV
jgi:hypothetical protein